MLCEGSYICVDSDYNAIICDIFCVMPFNNNNMYHLREQINYCLNCQSVTIGDTKRMFRLFVYFEMFYLLRK